jgi:hypothetical protein
VQVGLAFRCCNGRPRDVVQVQARVDSGPLTLDNPPQPTNDDHDNAIAFQQILILHPIIPRFTLIFFHNKCSTSDLALNDDSSSKKHEHTGTTLKECFVLQQNRLLYDSLTGATKDATKLGYEQKIATTGTRHTNILPTSRGDVFSPERSNGPQP